MHPTSMKSMKQFVVEYALQKAKVVDIGSLDINGTYRELFPGGDYIGVDLVAGPNVDIIMGSPPWKELKKVDVAICGQVLEHCADIPGLMAEMFHVLKPGGMACIIAPSAGPGHLEPDFFGNVSPEQMRQFVEDAGFEVIRCAVDPSCEWKDTVCVARKPE